MLRSVLVGASRTTLLVGFAAMLAAIFAGTPSYAADTQIDVTICSGTSSSASLVIDSPASDSVLENLPLNIAGTIAGITQIDISIDGGYNSTVPISVNQSSFMTSLQLTEGTHTITLVGNDVCQFQDVTETLVVTYLPKVIPTVGSTTPAVTPGAPTNPSIGTPVSREADGSGANPFENSPVLNWLRSTTKTVALALDFDVTARQGGILIALARFLLFVMGIVLAFFAAAVVRALRKRAHHDQLVEGQVQGEVLQDPQLRAHTYRDIRIMRGVGVFFLSLVFLI